MPTVVLVTPVYATSDNGRLKLLEQTLRSAADQKDQKDSNYNLLLLVVDDGSTVDVNGLIEDQTKYQIKYQGASNTRYLRRERSPEDLRTASNALNFGIDQVLKRSGDVFTHSEAHDIVAAGYLHSDDFLARGGIEKRLNNLPNGYVYTDMALFNNDGGITKIRRSKGYGIKEYAPGQKDYSNFNHHTILWEINFLQYLKDYVAKKYEQNSLYNPKFFFGEDFDVSLSTMEAAINGGYEDRYLPIVSVLYRVHEKSITGETADYRSEMDKVFQRHFGDEGKASSIQKILDRLQSNPPWSWFTFLPPKYKENLRPSKDYAELLATRIRHKKLIKNLEGQIASYNGR